MELLQSGNDGRDLFFNSFGSDIGTQLDQLKFEFEEMENGNLIKEEEPKSIEEEKENDVTDLETKINKQLEQNNISNGDGTKQQPKDDSKKSRTSSISIQRAFSTVSLMTSFKSNFWKHRRGRNGKGEKDETRQRHDSTSSETRAMEKNNNGLPTIKVNGESEGRATIYSTIVRPPKGKKVGRSNTMSPNTVRPIEREVNELETLQRSESGNIYTPPVMVDGQLTYDYQYSTPVEGSPLHKPLKGGKLSRRNSISRLLRIRKSPKRSPNKNNSTPIKELYQKTVVETGSSKESEKDETPSKKTAPAPDTRRTST